MILTGFPEQEPSAHRFLEVVAFIAPEERGFLSMVGAAVVEEGDNGERDCSVDSNGDGDEGGNRDTDDVDNCEETTRGLLLFVLSITTSLLFFSISKVSSPPRKRSTKCRVDSFWML